MMVSYSELFSESKLFVHMTNTLAYICMTVYATIYNVDQLLEHGRLIHLG